MNITLDDKGYWTDGKGKRWKLVPEKMDFNQKLSASNAWKPAADGHYSGRMEAAEEVYDAAIRESPLPMRKSRYDWSKIPEGFDWAATDFNGEQFAYMICPTTSGIDGWGVPEGNEVKFIGDVLIKHHKCPDWRESLERRP